MHIATQLTRLQRLSIIRAPEHIWNHRCFAALAHLQHFITLDLYVSYCGLSYQQAHPPLLSHSLLRVIATAVSWSSLVVRTGAMGAHPHGEAWHALRSEEDVALTREEYEQLKHFSVDWNEASYSLAPHGVKGKH